MLKTTGAGAMIRQSTELLDKARLGLPLNIFFHANYESNDNKTLNLNKITHRMKRDKYNATKLGVDESRVRITGVRLMGQDLVLIYGMTSS